MLGISPLVSGYLLTCAALLGLVAGSFCNAWACRLAQGESIVRGRSHCATCGHTLAPRDLVPVFSYLFLRGRCRYCGRRVSLRYPGIELICCAYFISILLRYDLLTPLQTLRWALLGCLLLVLALVDFDTMEMPNGLLCAVGVLALLRLPDEGLVGVRSGLIGCVAVSIPLLLFVLLMDRITGRETMGGGDIKLFFVLGLHFGPLLTLLLLIVACIAGMIFGILGRSKGRPIPFGPSIALAAWIVCMIGRPVADWYLGFFQ